MWSRRTAFQLQPCDLISSSCWQQQWHACLFFYRRDNLTPGRRTLSGVLYCLYRLSCLKLGPACGPAVVQHHYADPCDSADRSDPRRALVWKTRLGLITACIPQRETSAGRRLVRIVTLSFSTFHDAFLVVLFSASGTNKAFTLPSKKFFDFS